MVSAHYLRKEKLRRWLVQRVHPTYLVQTIFAIADTDLTIIKNDIENVSADHSHNKKSQVELSASKVATTSSNNLSQDAGDDLHPIPGGDQPLNTGFDKTSSKSPLISQQFASTAIDDLNPSLQEANDGADDGTRHLKVNQPRGTPKDDSRPNTTIEQEIDSQYDEPLSPEEEYWENFQTEIIDLFKSPSLLISSYSENDKAEDSLAANFVLPTPYIKSFMKHLIQSLEADNIPLSECVSEYYAELLMSEMMGKASIESNHSFGTTSSETDTDSESSTSSEYSSDDDDDSDEFELNNSPKLVSMPSGGSEERILTTQSQEAVLGSYVSTSYDVHHNSNADSKHENFPEELSDSSDKLKLEYNRETRGDTVSGMNTQSQNDSRSEKKQAGVPDYNHLLEFDDLKNLDQNEDSAEISNITQSTDNGADLIGLLDFDDLGDFDEDLTDKLPSQTVKSHNFGAADSETDFYITSMVNNQELAGTQNETQAPCHTSIGENSPEKEIHILHLSPSNEANQNAKLDNVVTKLIPDSGSQDITPDIADKKTKLKSKLKKQKRRRKRIGELLLTSSTNQNIELIAYPVTLLNSNSLKDTKEFHSELEHDLPDQIPTDTKSTVLVQAGNEITAHNSYSKCPYIFIAESPNVISANGSTGHRTWEAALALSDYILTEFSSNNLTDEDLGSSWIPSQIIELGAGTGLAGLVAASHFSAETLVLTDGDEEIVAGLKENVERNIDGALTYYSSDNNTPKQVQTFSKKLWWGNKKDFKKVKKIMERTCNENRENDVMVLAADVTYDAAAAPYLVSCLVQFLNTEFAFKSQIRVLLAATMRSEVTFAEFQLECVEAGLEMVLCKEYQRPVASDYFFFPPASANVRIYEVFKI